MKLTAILFGIATAASIMISCAKNTGTFVLINKANESIAQASVTVCGQTINMKDIPPTKSGQGSYEVKSDSHYDVIVEFESGKKLQKPLGYVTNGMNFHHEIIVTDEDIGIEDERGKR